MMVTRVAREAVGLSQAFPTIAMGSGVRPTGAFLSQAETTLNRNPAAVGVRLMDRPPQPQAAGIVNNSSLVTAAEANTHGRDFVTASTLSSVQTGNPGVRKNTQRNIDRIKANKKNTSNRMPNRRTWGKLTSSTLTRLVSSKFKSTSYRP
jgi:hypothetical protein